MRIDSSGNVGIGITSGLEKFTVVNASSGIVGRFTNNTNQTLDLGVISGSGAAGGVYYNSANSGYHAFQVGGTERLRIDSSGNVLVGKTTADNTTAGTTIYGAVAKGAASFVRDAGNTLVLNRLTSDGEILAFRKDGTTVGSIGAYDGRPYLASSTVGIRISNALFPSNTSGVITDGAMNIGSSSGRFKDLYLSGNAYIDSSVQYGAGANAGTLQNLNVSIGTSATLAIDMGDVVTSDKGAGFYMVTIVRTAGSFGRHFVGIFGVNGNSVSLYETLRVSGITVTVSGTQILGADNNSTTSYDVNAIPLAVDATA